MEKKKVFGSVEELKWHLHAQLVKHKNEREAQVLMDALDFEFFNTLKKERELTPEEANVIAGKFGYEVKEAKQ